MKKQILTVLGLAAVMMVLMLPFGLTQTPVPVARFEVYDTVADKDMPSFRIVNGNYTPEGWMRQRGLNGYKIQSDKGTETLELMADTDVDVVVALRGPDVPKDPHNPKAGRVEQWVSYTTLTADGVPMIKDPVAAWHDKTWTTTIALPKDQPVRLQVSWTAYDPSGHGVQVGQTHGLRTDVMGSVLLLTVLLWGLMIGEKTLRRNKSSETTGTDGSAYGRLFLGTTVVMIVAVLALIRADVLYYDDLNRNFGGVVKDWIPMNRPLGIALIHLMGCTDMAVNIAPVSQILTLMCLACIGCVFVRVLAPERANAWIMAVALVPLAINPFFMENISYQIECIASGVAPLFCVAPLLLYRRRNWLFAVAAGVGAILMCLTYQGVSGVFPMCVLLAASLEWNAGRSVRDVGRLMGYGLGGYGVGLAVFAVVLMKPVAYAGASSEIWTAGAFIPGVFHNIGMYYTQVSHYLTPLWSGLCLSVCIAFGVVYVLSSRRSAMSAVLMAGLTVLSLGLVCFGVYVFLAHAPVQPRILSVFFYMIGLMSVVVVARSRWVGCGVVCLMTWAFISFAAVYGNALMTQKEYTQTKMAMVMAYLNEHYDSQNKYTLDIIGNGGRAPALEKRLVAFPILKTLLPGTLNWNGKWGRYPMYSYTGIPDNFDRDLWLTRGLDKLNLPKKASRMAFDVYGDEKNILIRLK